MSAVLDAATYTDDHEGWRERLVLELLYGTGMRLAELIGVKENQVNLREQTIGVIGKRNKEREIPFAKPLAEVIRGYLKARNREVEANESGFLIVNKTGGKCYPMMIYRIVSRPFRGARRRGKAQPPCAATHVCHTFAQQGRGDLSIHNEQNDSLKCELLLNAL